MKKIGIPSQLAATALVLVYLALCTAPARTAQDGGQPKKIVTIEGITEYRLDNGLRYLLFPDQSSAKVTVNLIVFVGSRHEGYGETGMAHLLEHMMFKGSKLFPKVDKVLTKHGAEANGTTWVDRTNYYETMPATDENLEFGIRLEADRLVNSFIRHEDLAKEMTVVRNEFEMGENDPETILSQRMLAAAYEWHNYGKVTIGNRADIERVPIESLQAFYRKHYQPDNVMLVIAGKFDQEKAQQYIQKYFGPLPRPKRVLSPTYTEEPPQDGERTVNLRRTGTISVIGAIYHVPAASHPDCAAVEVLASILTTAPSGRLYKALVETKKASRVSGFAPAWHDPGILELTVRVADDSTPQDVRDTMLKVVENIAKEPITQEEVDRSRQQLLAQWERAFTNSKSIAIQLSEWAGAGDWRLMFIHRDRIKKMTAEQVNAAARKYLIRSNRTLGIFYPTPAQQIVRAEIPEGPPVHDLVKDYKGGKGLVQGETFDPTPENLENRVQRLKLPGGVKAALLPKKTRGEVVIASLNLHFGNEKSLMDQKVAASFVGAMLTRGTQKYTRQQLRDELDKLQAVLSISSSPGALSVTIVAKRKTLPAVLDLAAEALRHPTFPEKEFDILKRTTVQSIKKGLTEPDRLAITALRRKLNPYPKDSYRYVPTVAESVKLAEKVTLDQVKAVYQEQIGAAHGELVIVGDFEPDSAVDRVKTIVTGWAAKVPYERIPKIAHTEVSGSRESIVTPDKENAIYLAGYHLKVKDTAPEFPALEMANFALGGAGFISLITDRLRQKEGLSYESGTDFTADALDPFASFVIIGSCKNENIDQVDKAVQEVLVQARTKGISSSQMEEYRKGYTEQLKLAFAKDEAVVGLLQEGLYLNRTLLFYADLENKIRKLTAADVNRGLQQLTDANRLVIIRAGDFRKKAAPK